MLTPQAGLPDLDSFSYMPMFNFRQELRAPHFDPTLIALVSVETVDQSNKEVRIVGYGGINFFLGRASLKQPGKETETVKKKKGRRKEVGRKEEGGRREE